MKAYATPVDPTAAVQRAVADEAVSDLIPSEPPPIYRFSILIERARYYVQVAQQLEALLLASFKEGDQERYNLLKAKQDFKMAQANVAMQALRVREATDSLTLAHLQIDTEAFEEVEGRLKH